MSVYNKGLDLLRDIATADFRWALLKGTGYTFNRDHDFMDDLVPASNEVSASGYARVAISGEARAVNNTSDRINYTADDPDFGTLATGQNATALVLYLHVTNDADSVPVLHLPFTSTDTNAIDPFTVLFTGGVIAYLDEA